VSKVKLLVISYLFPPAGGIAVQRVLSFVRYLPAEHYEIHVLTARNPRVPTFDEALVGRIPKSVRVHRLLGPGLPSVVEKWLRGRIGGAKQPQATAGGPGGGSRHVCWVRAAIGSIACPDAEVFWVPGAIVTARRLVAHHSIHVALVTAPPFDFRDEWLQFYYPTFALHQSESILRRLRRIERETVCFSDAVLTVTESNRRTMLSRYPDLPAEKFVHLPNGYDPEVFAGFRPRAHAGDGLVVTHLGTVYKTSTPAYLLDAIERLPDRVRDRVELRFIGRITEEQRPLLEGRNVKIRCFGFLPQAQALELAAASDFLFLSMTDPNFASGKIYEYLGMGIPILALCPRGGEVDRILQETGAGWSADPQEPEAVRSLLLHALGEGTARTSLPQRNVAKIREYERPQVVARLDQLIRGGLLAEGFQKVIRD